MPTALKATVDPKLLATTGNLKANNPRPSSLLGYLQQTGQIKTPGVEPVVKPIQSVMKPMSQELPVQTKTVAPIQPGQMVRPDQPLIAGNVSPQSLKATSESLGQLDEEEKAFLIKAKNAGFSKQEAIDSIQRRREQKQSQAGRYDSNLFAGAADYYQNDVMGAIQGSDNKLINNPITRSLAGVGAMGFKGLRDVTQGGGELLDKGLAKVGLGDKKYKGSTVGENLYDIGQGAVNTLATAYAPVAMATIGAGLQALPENAQKAVGEVMGDVGGFISQAPGLKQWRESLPVYRRQEFDNEVAGAAIGLLTGLKGKKNIVKNPKLFLKQNLNPVNIAKNFQENVLNLPANAVGTAKAIPGAVSDTIQSVKKIPQKISDSIPEVRGTKQAKRVASRLIDSKLKLTDTNKRKIAQASGKDPIDFIMENKIIGNNMDETINNTQKMIDSSMFDKIKGLESVKKTFDFGKRDKALASEILRQGKEELLSLGVYGDDFDSIKVDELLPEHVSDYYTIKNLEEITKSGKITASQKEAVKSLFDALQSKVKRNPEKSSKFDAFKSTRLAYQAEIEKIGKSVGLDIKGLNKNIAGGYALRKGLAQASNRMDNLNIFGLTDGQAAAISAIMGGGAIETIGLLGGKAVMENLGVRGKIADYLYNKNGQPKNNNLNTNNRATASSNISTALGRSDSLMNNVDTNIQRVKKPGTTKVNPNAKVPLAKKENGSIMDGMKKETKVVSKELQPLYEEAKGKDYDSFVKSFIRSKNKFMTNVDTFKPLSELDSQELKRAIGTTDWENIPKEVTLYRGIKENIDFDIRPGDFLTKNRKIAEDFAKGGKVKSFKVKSKDLLGDTYGNEEVIYTPNDQLRKIREEANK